MPITDIITTIPLPVLVVGGTAIWIATIAAISDLVFEDLS